SPAQQRPDPGQEFGQPEWLGHVIVGARVKADNGVYFLRARGQDQHRGVLSGKPQPSADLESVHPWQPDVEHNEVDPAGLGDLEGARPIGGNADLISLAPQSPCQRFGNRRVVLGEQYASHALDAKTNIRNYPATTLRNRGNHLVKSAFLVANFAPLFPSSPEILKDHSHT